MLGIIISIISGTLMSVQGVFNTEVTKQTSIWVAASFVQASALITCIIAWIVTNREGSFGSIISVRPVYMLSGGIMGAFITYTVILGMNRLGPAKSVIFIIIAQIVSAYLIELLGLFGTNKTSFHWSRIAGVILMIAGILIFKWQDAHN